MYLGKLAARYINEPLMAFDPVTKTWTPDFLRGRISITDRFLSNFNKPLRRRMLFTRPGTTFPESLTIKHPGSQDVYLVGQRREDTFGAEDYNQLTVLHMVTDEGPGGSSGLAELHRKVPMGPADDPGWLEDSVVLECYVDFELRSSSNVDGAYEVTTEKFFAHLPRSVEPHKKDFIHLHGRVFRVVDIYSDSGFTMARVDEELDDRVNLVIKVNEGKRYDPDLMRYVSDSRSYNVTGTIVREHDYASWSDDSADYFDVVIDADHIGFLPKPGNVVVYQGVERTVRQVQTQPGHLQYKLRCE